MEGVKHDQEKPRFDLLHWGVMREVAEVMTYGAKKYDDWNWLKVPNGRERYFSAGMRHLVSAIAGEERDKESGLRHIAHAIACFMILAHFLQFAINTTDTTKEYNNDAR